MYVCIVNAHIHELIVVVVFHHVLLATLPTSTFSCQHSFPRRWHQLNQINIFLPTPPHLIIPPCCILSDPRSLRVISSCQMCPHRAPWLTEMYLFVFFIDGWILLLTRPKKTITWTSRPNLAQQMVLKLLNLCSVQSKRIQSETWTPPPLGLRGIFPLLTPTHSRQTTEVCLCPS